MNTTSRPLRVMIVTGEASGDLHGAKLIKDVRSMAPGAEFFGVGGHEMAAAGCDIVIPGEELAVMGLVEVLGHFPVIWRSFQTLKRLLHGERKPDALVLIDFPEFNLRLAKQAKRAGVAVLYYVSPQVWAWRRGRVRKIAQVVDSLAAIFPFEPALYEGEDIKVEYVGHPLLDEFEVSRPRDRFLGQAGVPIEKRIVGLFPGSRKNEIRFMLETIVETARQIHSRSPDVHFLVPIAGTLSADEIKTRFDKDLPVTFFAAEEANIYDIANACDAVLTVSGTVTLQIALSGTPMVIIYKLAALSYAIGKCLVRVDHVGLANIVAGRRIVPEYLQNEASPENLSAAVCRILDDDAYARTMRSDLREVRGLLGEPGCTARVAGMLMNMVGRSTDH